MEQTKVLITSGTDLTSAHLVAGLLEAGLRVRVALRSITRAPDVQEMVVAAGADPNAGLGFVEADLGSEEGWPAAVDGRDAVVHVAGGREDTTARVVTAARAAGVASIVLVPQNAAPIEPTVGVTVIRHASLLGPALTPEHLDDCDPVGRLLHGRPPFVMPWRYSLVDVRDMATLVARCLETQEEETASLPPVLDAVTGVISERAIAAQLRDMPGPGVDRVPWLRAPGVLVRAGIALWPPAKRRHAQRSSADVVNGPGGRLPGWRPRPLEETIADTAESIIELTPAALLDRSLPGAGPGGLPVLR